MGVELGLLREGGYVGQEFVVVGRELYFFIFESTPEVFHVVLSQEGGQ